MASFADISIRFKANLKQFSSQMKNAERRMKKVGKRFESVGKNMSRNISAPLALVGGLAVKTFASFDDKMRKVGATAGATGDELKQLSETAQELGSRTAFSASQAADGLNFMALAGFNTKESIEALPNVLNLASASAMGLGQASDIVTDNMNAFNIAASEADRVSDVLAKTQSSANTSVEQLGEAFKLSSANANSFGISIETTSAVLGKFADAGIKGSRAGTTFDAMLRDLKKSADDGILSINGQNIALADAEGNFRNILDIMQDVETATKGLTQQQQDQALSSVFQARSLRGVNVLMNQGIDATKGLESELQNAEGTAKSMAEAMEAGLGGSMRKLQSAVESAGIAIGEVLAPVVSKIANFVGGLIAKFKDLSPAMKETIVIIGGIVAAVGPLLAGLGFLMTTVIPGLGIAFSALSAPILAISAAIAGIAYVIYDNWDAIKRELTSLANYFIDLYNESIIFRVAIESIVLQFKTLFEIGKLVFEGLKTAIKAFFNQAVNQIKTFGKLFKAVLTGNFSDIPDILKQNAENTKEIFSETISDISDDISNFSSNVADDVQDSLDRIGKRKKLTIETTAKVNEVEVTDEAKEDASKQITGGSGRARTQSVTAGTGIESRGRITTDFASEMKADTDSIVAQGQRITKTMATIKANAKLIGGEVGNAFSNFTGKFIDALDLADSGMQGFVKNMAKTISELLTMLLSNAIANAIAGATQGALGTGPAAPFTQPAFISTMVGGVLSAFAAIPKFAEGGIVSGETLGIMGEYSGAKNNPEVVAPLDKLKSMLGETSGAQRVIVDGKLSGQDILISNERASKYRNRRS